MDLIIKIARVSPLRKASMDWLIFDYRLPKKYLQISQYKQKKLSLSLCQ